MSFDISHFPHGVWMLGPASVRENKKFKYAVYSHESYGERAMVFFSSNGKLLHVFEDSEWLYAKEYTRALVGVDKFAELWDADLEWQEVYDTWFTLLKPEDDPFIDEFIDSL